LPIRGTDPKGLLGSEGGRFLLWLDDCAIIIGIISRSRKWHHFQSLSNSAIFHYRIIHECLHFAIIGAWHS
jgi:hypothetical protein